MRRAALAIVSTIAALVMILSFKTHAATTATTPPAAVSSTSPTTTTPATTPSATSGTTKTVTGNAVDTRYGPVQVRVTVTNGKVTAANAIDYPQNDPRDQQINAYAIPVLNQEAVQAGSANIDMVSGATYTSDGYIQSLQSALDKAKA